MTALVRPSRSVTTRLVPAAMRSAPSSSSTPHSLGPILRNVFMLAPWFGLHRNAARHGAAKLLQFEVDFVLSGRRLLSGKLGHWQVKRDADFGRDFRLVGTMLDDPACQIVGVHGWLLSGRTFQKVGDRAIGTDLLGELLDFALNNSPVAIR